jgi:hypothetical protein
MKINLSILATTACALLLGNTLTASNLAAAKTNKNMTKTAAAPRAWPQEALTGRITMVDPGQNLVVVQTSDGVPYDLNVTTKTRIKSGDRSVALKDLTRDINTQVSVEFIPERRGDVARSIRISG